MPRVAQTTSQKHRGTFNGGMEGQGSSNVTGAGASQGQRKTWVKIAACHEVLAAIIVALAIPVIIGVDSSLGVRKTSLPQDYKLQHCGYLPLFPSLTMLQISELSSFPFFKWCHKHSSLHQGNIAWTTNAVKQCQLPDHLSQDNIKPAPSPWFISQTR
ncbi:hypothetical protein DFH07DRAFT_764922 [Mycena maculata]|uniref:Uncharacterized protein n=1 Tax=Mycena maculata TaxID=230809 RepID=A0AAD7NZC6_9AGAR|nr:hypothetical protein DFH07DRAFT_764922 [Mycena maculata]